MNGHFAHVTGLHRTAELPPQFVGAGLDHRIVRHTDDRAVGPIQSNRNSGRFLKQFVQLLLKSRCRSVHESASAGSEKGSPKCQVAALYHRIDGFLY